MDRVAAYLDSLIDPRTGLVTYTATDGADLVDWPPAMQYGYDMGTVAHTTTNVLAADVFDAPARWRGCSARVARRTASKRADRLVTAINTKLTRPTACTSTGSRPNGSPSTHASQQASEFALSFGIVPAAHVAAVGKYVASLGIKTGPLDGLYLLDGLQAAGRTDDVVKVLTDTKDPGWANVVAEGGTFVWESWILIDLEGDGMSHGWGSSALVAFQNALLGVPPAVQERGGREEQPLMIRIGLGGVEARERVLGDVRVGMQRGPAGQLGGDRGDGARRRVVHRGGRDLRRRVEGLERVRGHRLRNVAIGHRRCSNAAPESDHMSCRDGPKSGADHGSSERYRPRPGRASGSASNRTVRARGCPGASTTPRLAIARDAAARSVDGPSTGLITSAATPLESTWCMIGKMKSLPGTPRRGVSRSARVSACSSPAP